jgi:GTP-binding protein
MSRYPGAAFVTSAAAPAQFVADRGAEIAFAGRSNAGKSSAINAILGRRQLARTSRTPGRTQLVNFFALDGDLRLVDLPGYGFAKVPEPMRRGWQRLMGAYFGGRRSLTGLFVIVDARRGLKPLDEQMLGWAADASCPAHVLLTKADKLSKAERQRVLAGARRSLGGAATVQLFSATDGLGVEEARARMEALLGRAGNGDADG